MFRITFIDPDKHEHVVAVETPGTPHSGYGLPGSLLDIAWPME